MKRREMLMCLVATVGSAAVGFRLPLGYAQDYLGKLFVFVQADGGWDPTSFCDPKANTPDERSSTTGRSATRFVKPALFPMHRSPTTRRFSRDTTLGCW